MEKKIAGTISIVFHPMLIPTYATLIFFNLNSYISQIIAFKFKWLILGMIFITTFLFPALFIFILMTRGVIKSLQMETREERVYPFMITALFYFLSFYMIRRIPISDVYQLFLLGSAILIAIGMFINFYSKISIHMIGTGGLLGAVIGLSVHLNIGFISLIIVLILISGLTGFARLKLNAHSPGQIYSGFLTGLIIMLLIFLS